MSKSKCCVLGCNSSPPHFKFPTSRVLIRKWLAALGSRCQFKTVDPHASGSVCSRHFLTEEWECARGRVRLKKGVIPSLFDEYIIQENNSHNLTHTVPNTGDKHKDNEEIKTDDSRESLRREDQQKESDNPQKEKDVPEKDSPQKEKSDPQKESDPSKESDQQKDMLGENELSDEKKNSGEERLQEKEKETEEAANSNNSLDSMKSKDKSKESSPKLPSGPRDIDKNNLDIDKNNVDIDKDKVEDIEDLLTYYHIKQNNIHQTEEISEDQNGTGGDGAGVNGTQEVEIEIDPIPAADPVFIEISVDKDTSANGGDKNDCLMVMESVQVEVDPSALMLQEQDFQEADMEVETLEIDEDPPNEKEDPISLLTSSDEDDVIIQEPHIDTVEVSDETDEDDMPLVKLLRKRRAEKKKNVKKAQKKDTNIAQITWGMYEYYCVQCHFKTSNAADYRRHMAAHAKVILMCQLCGYMTASSSQFAKHEKQHGEKTYKCELCDFKAKRNMSLVYHMKTHKKTKEYKCGECDFVAYNDQAILRHLRFCKDGKRYKCNKCSYSTKKRSDLKRHKSRKHADEEDLDEDYVPPARCLD